MHTRELDVIAFDLMYCLVNYIGHNVVGTEKAGDDKPLRTEDEREAVNYWDECACRVPGGVVVV